MSRGFLAFLLIFIGLIIFFSVTRQQTQGQETVFLFGFILGLLIGWWTGGYRVLRRLRKEEHGRVDTTFQQRKENHL